MGDDSIFEIKKNIPHFRSIDKDRNKLPMCQLLEIFCVRNYGLFFGQSDTGISN